MDHEDLRHWSKRAADWAADYHAGLRDRPVRAPLVPGAVSARLPATAPDQPEAMEQIILSITSFALYGFPESHAAIFSLLLLLFLYSIAEVLLLFFIGVLLSLYLGGVTDMLQRRLSVPRGLGLAIAVTHIADEITQGRVIVSVHLHFVLFQLIATEDDDLLWLFFLQRDLRKFLAE